MIVTQWYGHEVVRNIKKYFELGVLKWLDPSKAHRHNEISIHMANLFASSIPKPL